jgi:hypothetical protein
MPTATSGSTGRSGTAPLSPRSRSAARRRRGSVGSPRTRRPARPARSRAARGYGATRREPPGGKASMRWRSAASISSKVRNRTLVHQPSEVHVLIALTTRQSQLKVAAEPSSFIATRSCRGL